MVWRVGCLCCVHVVHNVYMCVCMCVHVKVHRLALARLPCVSQANTLCTKALV